MAAGEIGAPRDFRDTLEAEGSAVPAAPMAPYREHLYTRRADGGRECVKLAPGRLGAGGEGRIYALEASSTLAAKIYLEPTALHRRKLQAMIAMPPRDPDAGKGHVSYCWPQQLLFRAGAPPHVVGFLMQQVDLSTHIPVAHLYNPQARQTRAPGFDWSYLVKTAANIARVVESLHASGYVVGDINESNLLVSNQALVTLVDCDSIQVPRKGGGHFRCTVRTRTFTPPELLGRDLTEVDQTVEHDRFALAALLFQLLMEGTPPFAGVWQGPGSDSCLDLRIMRGDSPFLGSPNVLPPPFAPPFEMLPEGLRTLVQRGLAAAPQGRPSAREWSQALEALEQALVRCPVNPRHLHSGHLEQCPWCVRTARLGGQDPFPAPSMQQALSPTVFITGPQGCPRTAPAATAVATRPLIGQWALLLLSVLLVVGMTVGWKLLKLPPVTPQDEIRIQNERLRELHQEGLIMGLEEYLEGTQKAHLEKEPGIAIEAAQAFTEVKPLWSADDSRCLVPAGTPMRLKTYLDNEGYFASGHYSAVVTLQSSACPPQGRLMIVPMSALPPRLRLLDCPGKGGGLQGFAWHSTEEYSCTSSTRSLSWQ